MKISKYIDYIDDPNDTFEQYLEKAKQYNFRCIFAELDQFAFASEYLKDTDIIIAGAIDFPDGILTLEEKIEEFQRHYEVGFKEIDYVLNQHAIETRDYETIYTEMKVIAQFAREKGICDKAIVEMCKLDEEAKIEVCKLARKAKPVFLKTSTGKSFAGASLEDVKLMKSILHDEVKIKAAGGVKNLSIAQSFIEAGASALGASAGIEIVEENNQKGAC